MTLRIQENGRRTAAISLNTKTILKSAVSLGISHEASITYGYRRSSRHETKKNWNSDKKRKRIRHQS